MLDFVSIIMNKKNVTLCTIKLNKKGKMEYLYIV
jgi:hypothetical protein